jgi:hypothetical protein
LTEPKRIVITNSQFTYLAYEPSRTVASFAVSVAPSAEMVDAEKFTIPLQHSTACLMIPMDSPRYVREGAYEKVARDLALFLGYEPREVMYREDAVYMDRRPHWWDLLRRLGLRRKETDEWDKISIHHWGAYVREINTIAERAVHG